MIQRQGSGKLIKRAAPLASALAILLAAAGARAADTAAAAVTSHWSGTTKVRCGTFTSDHTRCSAVQNITLTLVQQGTKVSGSYTCAYGNQNCRGMQESGAIMQGTLTGHKLALVIVAPDKSTCRFSGLLRHDSGKGNYSCKGGSQLDERGTWRIQRKE